MIKNKIKYYLKRYIQLQGENKYKKQRDEARIQRDEARIQRDEARLERDKILYEGQVNSLKNEITKFDKNYYYKPREQRVSEYIQKSLRNFNSNKKIKILEIGGRENPRDFEFSQFKYEYKALDIEKTGDNVIVGNLESCPEIPDNSFDFILSVDVFEHISQPWLAANEIYRLLKKGGVTYHTTLFSWRYHAVPEDYWRYTTAGLDQLFSKFNKICSDFDAEERRRNIIGKTNRLQPDHMGGWRENWRVHGIYKKN